MYFIKALYDGLLMLFAWVPATLLMLFVLFGFFSVAMNFGTVDWKIHVTLIAVCVGGAVGYIGLTSVCWKLIKLSALKKIVFLSIGIITLIYVVYAGASSGQELLAISDDWVEWYLFIGPIVMTGIHLIYLLLDMFGKQANSPN